MCTILTTTQSRARVSKLNVTDSSRGSLIPPGGEEASFGELKGCEEVIPLLARRLFKHKFPGARLSRNDC